MKREKRWQWQSCVAVVAAGVLVFGLALQGAPPEGIPAKQTSAEGHTVKVGPGIPVMSDIPIFPPVTVDYRDKGAVTRHGPGATALGMDDLAFWEPSGPLSKARTAGDPCLIAEQCYTCNVCIDYDCIDESCVEFELGTDLRCASGENAGDPCTLDTDCDPEPNEDACTIASGDNIAGCDDGDYCNGAETCSGGVCSGGTDPCTLPDVCDEAQDACVDACTSAAGCADGASCTDDTCGGDGVCVHANACGPGARCLEPAAPGADPPICIPGRCCASGEPVAGCSREIYADCTTNWLGVGSSETTCEDLISQCPAYGSGFEADATVGPEIGIISNLDCDDYLTVGDDYETWDYAPDNYMNVTFMRFVARVEPGSMDGARWSIEFRDENGVLIVDTFYPDGQNDEGGFGIRQVIFDPAITIPTKGIVSFTVQANFGLDGRVNLYGTTATENGSNNTASMYIDTGPARVPQIRDFLGVCSGGTRPGLHCDVANGNGDCTGGGTCDNVDDILAFELIGTTGITPPKGACCDSGTGDCTQALPWECTGSFQGVGTLCGICEDGTTPCSPDDPPPGPCAVECFPIPSCDTKACCHANGDCTETAGDCPSGTQSLGFGTDCDPNCCLQPVTSYQGADNCIAAEPGMPIINVPALGQPPEVVTITSNNSAATYDDSDLVCQSGPNERQTCVTDEDCGVCVGGGNAGEPCDEDSDCPDPFIGACDVHACDEICDRPFLDEDGETRDPGWWVAFSVVSADDCADLRIDLCCSDVDGDVVRPGWAMMYGACPCDDVQSNVAAARGAPHCDNDNLWMTFRVSDGIYYYPVYSAPGGTSASPPGTDFQLHIAAEACPIAACCTGNACAVVNEVACDELEGNWLAGVVTCGNDPNCALPPNQTDNECCTGACCTGTEVGVICLDQTPAGQPITLTDCVAEDGTYVGGATCADDPDPCPTCLVESEVNCQESAQTTVRITDIDPNAAPDLRRADDFVATGLSIDTVCITGAWIDAAIDCNPPGGGARCDCACEGDNQLDCVTQTQDVFTVCIWNDLGTVPGFSTIPDDFGLAGCSATSFTRSNNYGPDSTWNFDEYTVSLVLDTPIATTIGQIYWVHVTGDTTLPLENTCNFYWSADGDLDEPGEDPSGNDNVIADLGGGVFETRDIRSWDHAWCLNYAVEPPPVPATGACCSCSPLGDCTNNVISADCVGNWKLGETCGPDTCPQVRPPNDDCVAGIMPVEDGLNFFNNLCATTDGSASVPCGGASDTDIGGDIWYAYMATCSGLVTVSMCDDADYDGMLEVYTDHTTTCPCPGTGGSAEVCGDDTCGVTFGPAVVEVFVEEEDIGNCYTIRVAGWRSLPDDDIPACLEGCQGSGSFTVECTEVSCVPTDAPEPDPEPVPTDIGAGTKNRYMTFSMADQGEPIAIRVTFDAIPGHPAATGRTMWVQAPGDVTEASCCNGPTPPPVFSAARLGCTPYYDANWSTYGRVDVYDDAIIPDALFSVQAIRESCEVAVEEHYSLPLPVRMSKAGDIVGDCGPRPCTAPQGVVDFVDISACVEKFRNLPAAPRKARADVINSNITLALPDLKVDFVDISCVVAAFRNDPCIPPGPPATDPCE